MTFRDQARDGARLVLGPIWRRVWARIENRLRPIEQRIERAEQRIERVEQLDAAWNQHAPAFLNAVATVGAFGHELAALRRQVAALEAAASGDAAARLGDEVGQLSKRLELIREEALYEIRYGRRDASALVPAPTVAPAVRLALGGAHPRLNLGCGHLPLPGYVNIDRRNLPGVDVVADVDHLPVEPGSVAEIHSGHLLEHFPQEGLRRCLLPYWFGLLRPAGLFRAVVPDGSAMLAGIADGSYPFEDFRLVLFGAQDYTGNFHYNLLTPDGLAALLGEAGFVEIEIPARARRNGRCFEFEIVGRKPAGEPARAAANE